MHIVSFKNLTYSEDILGIQESFFQTCLFVHSIDLDGLTQNGGQKSGRRNETSKQLIFLAAVYLSSLINNLPLTSAPDEL